MDGSTTAVGTSAADYSVDGFVDFENTGGSDLTLTFMLDWSYDESATVDNPVYDGSFSSSFILLTEIWGTSGVINDLFELDTLFTPGLADTDSGSLSFSRILGSGEFYTLELAITAEGSAYSDDVPLSVPEPASFWLFGFGLAGLYSARRRDLT